MVYRYEKSNFPLFEFLTESQKRFLLPSSSRRMLGFLLINSLDFFIDSLIAGVYYKEITERPIVDIIIEKMLESLRRQPEGKYFGQTNNQIVSNIIQENAMEYYSVLERQIESDQGREMLRQLLLT